MRTGGRDRCGLSLRLGRLRGFVMHDRWRSLVLGLYHGRFFQEPIAQRLFKIRDKFIQRPGMRFRDGHFFDRLCRFGSFGMRGRRALHEIKVAYQSWIGSGMRFDRSFALEFLCLRRNCEFVALGGFEI